MIYRLWLDSAWSSPVLALCVAASLCLVPLYSPSAAYDNYYYEVNRLKKIKYGTIEREQVSPSKWQELDIKARWQSRTAHATHVFTAGHVQIHTWLTLYHQEHVLGDHPTHPLASCTFRNFKRATEGRFDTLTDTFEGDRPRLTRTGLKVPSFVISAEAGYGVRGFSCGTADDQKAWAYNEDGGTVTGDVPRVSSARARRDKDKDEAQVKADGSVETEARRRLDSRLSVGETNDVC
ncbi:hypothetical protein BYT27DRAFT_7263074 [Phlegmacium glaucopus]|nr:hypothetical protein BYT27DRAFT_7263074 [Phlegmacium glaucopus]